MRGLCLLTLLNPVWSGIISQVINLDHTNRDTWLIATLKSSSGVSAGDDGGDGGGCADCAGLDSRLRQKKHMVHYKWMEIGHFRPQRSCL